MKTIFKTFGLIILLATSSLSVSAQGKGKLGHINSNDLLLAMPERAVAEQTLQEEAKKLDTQLSMMTAEYQSKVADYQANLATMSELIKQTKMQEIGDLEQRIQQFQMSAQESLQVKESELLSPLVDKAKEAIEAVAADNGYTYIFDSSVGVLLVMPDSEDIMPLVRKKLGITEDAN